MSYLQADGLTRLEAIAHGFFTREGGVSNGLYATLNCGPGSQDDPVHVTENRARAAQALGASAAALCTLYQVHGAEVVTVSEPWPAAARPQADALVTREPGVLLGILTADCVPVLFADAQARVIGAAHAGWKGAFAGVIGNTVAAMQKLGAKPERVVAAIGPAIGWDSYEVDRAFLERFLSQDPRHEQFFKPGKDDAKYLFNVKAYCTQRLAEAGIARIEVLANDTYGDEQRWFSFRRTTHRSEPDYGRQLSAIMLTRT